MTHPMTYFYTPEDVNSPQNTNSHKLFRVDKNTKQPSALEEKKPSNTQNYQKKEKISVASELHKIRVHSKNPFF